MYRYGFKMLLPLKARNLVKREQDGYATVLSMLFIHTQGFPIEEERINVIDEESNKYLYINTKDSL